MLTNCAKTLHTKFQRSFKRWDIWNHTLNQCFHVRTRKPRLHVSIRLQRFLLLFFCDGRTVTPSLWAEGRSSGCCRCSAGWQQLRSPLLPRILGAGPKVSAQRRKTFHSHTGIKWLSSYLQAVLPCSLTPPWHLLWIIHGLVLSFTAFKMLLRTWVHVLRSLHEKP